MSMDLEPAYQDEVKGACVVVAGVNVLVVGEGWREAADDGALLAGELTLRYAVRYREGEEALVPQLVVDDHRQYHTGAELYRFLARRGLAYPRADIVGRRLSGEEDHTYLRNFDLARPLVVMAYAGGAAETSGVRVQLAVVLDADIDEGGWHQIEAGAGGLPTLLVEHVPCFGINPVFGDALLALVGGWLADNAPPS